MSNDVLDNNHLVVDLETLGRSDDAAVISVGLACGWWDKGEFATESVEFYPGLDAQQEAGLGKVDESTVAWWLKQDEDARLAAADALEDENAYNLPDLFVAIQAFLFRCRGKAGGEGAKWFSDLRVWGNSPQFDLGKLVAMEEAARKIERRQRIFPVLGNDHTLLNSWHVRDYRTYRKALESLLPDDFMPFKPPVKHSAAADALAELRNIIYMAQEIK